MSIWARRFAAFPLTSLRCPVLRQGAAGAGKPVAGFRDWTRTRRAWATFTRQGEPSPLRWARGPSATAGGDPSV